MSDREGLEEAGGAFVLAIHPRFADLIYAGRKTVEFRRRIPKGMRPGGRVFLYETAPVRKVTGSFVVAGIARLTRWNGRDDFEGCPVPHDLGALAAMGCLAEGELLRYAGKGPKEEGYGYASCYAILVSEPERLAAPKPIGDFGLRRWPQSFAIAREGKRNV